MIHKYTMNGYFIVLDVNSGAVHAVDKLCFDILDYYKTCHVDEIAARLPQYTAADIQEATDELCALEQAGLLFSPALSQNILQKAQAQAPVVKALCLHVAHDCNLTCRYCFAEEGEYRGQRALMDIGVGQKAIDFLIRHAGERRHLEVDFFGGEPLMNLDVVKAVTAYGRKQEKKYGKRFRFTLTTNGLLLNDDASAFINAEMENVVLSLDGRKAVNDQMRRKAGGQGSYDDIVPKLQKLVANRHGKSYYVRGTFTRENLDFGKDALHLADLGFRYISVEPVVGDALAHYTLRETDLPAIFQAYEQLAVDMLARQGTDDAFDFFHFMIDLTGGPCVIKRLSGCGAGTSYMAVTPEGDLYPCHQFVGHDAFKMGDVDNGIVNQEKWREFQSCGLFANEDCAACWAKYYCGGGCAANAFHMNGELRRPYALGCEMQRKRTECAIMIKVAQDIGC